MRCVSRPADSRYRERRLSIARILLIIGHRENRELLNAWISAYHMVVEHPEGSAIEEGFDLCIIDGPNLSRYITELEQRRELEHPGFLPVVLITPRRGVWASTPHLWQIVDEAIEVPVSKLEFQARLEILLRSRRMSQELKLRNDDMEAFMQAMSHDLKTSLRAVTMFTESLAQSQLERMDNQGRDDLNRIKWSADEMRELIDSLLNFSRLGRGEVRYEPIDLKSYIETVMRNLEGDIRTRGASIQMKGKSRTVQADPALMRIALTNLLSNAIKFVPDDRRPEVTVTASIRREICTIHVRDNGIGISKEDQQRIFMPFVRLHKEQEFPGVGLGLPSVRKAVEIMGGRVGVDSTPGQGSHFWIELNV